MEVRFHHEALAEFKAEVEYYETRQAGLGADFAAEVFSMIDLARLFPRMGTPEKAGVRSLVTKRFPFLIYYEVVGSRLWVWAVMHAARAPGYWKARRKT